MNLYDLFTRFTLMLCDAEHALLWRASRRYRLRCRVQGSVLDAYCVASRAGDRRAMGAWWRAHERLV